MERETAADPVKPAAVAARDPRVLAHIGSIYGARTPVPLLNSLRRLASQGRIQRGTLLLRFVGDYDDAGYLACKPIFDELSDLVPVEYENRHVPREEARRAMASANFLLLADNNSFGLGY